MTLTHVHYNLAYVEVIRKKCEGHPKANGIAVVIANRYAPGTKVLRGVIKDRDNMEKALETLRFAVVIATDIGRVDMLSLLDATAVYKYPHSYKRMIMVFSGHGEQEALCTHDGKVTIDEIKYKFTPVKIPKLFFIDACRGELRIESQRGGPPLPLTEYLMAFSTMPDYVSFENSNGGYWMSILSTTLFEDKSIFDVLTIVNAALEKKYPDKLKPALDAVSLKTVVNLFAEAG